MKTILITLLVSLAALQAILLVAYTRRLIIEVLIAVEMWSLGLGWEFDWSYVRRGN